MNAARSVHPLTAAAKVNWTLSRFFTPLSEVVHSHRFRTACRPCPRTEDTWPIVLEIPSSSVGRNGGGIRER